MSVHVCVFAYVWAHVFVLVHIHVCACPCDGLKLTQPLLPSLFTLLAELRLLAEPGVPALKYFVSLYHHSKAYCGSYKLSWLYPSSCFQQQLHYLNSTYNRVSLDQLLFLFQVRQKALSKLWNDVPVPGAHSILSILGRKVDRDPGGCNMTD